MGPKINERGGVHPANQLFSANDKTIKSFKKNPTKIDIFH